MQNHNIAPIYDENSRILILGSFPSVISRKEAFYYAHPQNRFWKMLSYIYKENTGDNPEEKKNFLLRHKLAVWDVISSCEIEKSKDDRISCVAYNDIEAIVEKTPVRKVLLNGKKAYSLYEKHFAKLLDIPFFYLPSTSPANAASSMDKLIEKWSEHLLNL